MPPVSRAVAIITDRCGSGCAVTASTSAATVSWRTGTCARRSSATANAPSAGRCRCSPMRRRRPGRGRLLAGFGPLQPFFDDPSVEEIWINGPDRSSSPGDGVSELTAARPHRRRGPRPGRADAAVHRAPRRPVARRSSTPRCPTARRLHVVIPDVTQRTGRSTSASSAGGSGPHDLVELGFAHPPGGRVPADGVLAGQNILVSGATQVARRRC